MDLTMIIIFSKKVLEKYWENTEKYMFSFDGKKVARIDGSGEDSTKTCLTDYDLLIVPDLWQTHYQILLTILLKKFITLNVNTDMMIKNVKIAELNTKIASVVLNI